MEPQNTVQNEAVQKSGFSKKISQVISLLILFFVIAIAIVVYSGFANTIEIRTSDADQLCGFDACLIADGRYEDGWAIWEVAPGMPLGFSFTTAGNFSEGQKIEIICPVNAGNSALQYLFDKISFLMDKDMVRQCVAISKA